MESKNKKFYYTTQWKKTAKSFKVYKNFMCENCNNMYINNDCKMSVEQQLQVHHKNPVTPEKILNNDSSLYDFDNLELLCIKCHNAERRTGGVCADGYKLVEGRMVKVNDK